MLNDAAPATGVGDKNGELFVALLGVPKDGTLPATNSHMPINYIKTKVQKLRSDNLQTT